MAVQQPILKVDFFSKTLSSRISKKSQDPLIKALGLKKLKKVHIIDLTAGLGQDAFVMAAFGAHVILIEKSPIIAKALKDGLQQANQSPELHPIVSKMQFIETDSLDYLKSLSQQPDIIYLDPMFELNKTAKPKKQMQLIQSFSENTNYEHLLELALTKASKRVVIKRHHSSGFLAGKKPNFSVIGKTIRFDAYSPKDIVL